MEDQSTKMTNLHLFIELRAYNIITEEEYNILYRAFSLVDELYTSLDYDINYIMYNRLGKSEFQNILASSFSWLSMEKTLELYPNYFRILSDRINRLLPIKQPKLKHSITLDW